MRRSTLRFGVASSLALALACATSRSTPPPATEPSTPPPDHPSVAASDPAPAPRIAEPPPAPSISRVGPFVPAVHGMAVDAEGLLYFSDTFARLDATPRVHRLAPPYTGEPEATSVSGSRPAGLAFIEGSLHVCDVGADLVTRYDAELAPQQTWTVPSPWNVSARSPSVLVAVSFDGRLFELTADGAVHEQLAGLDAPFATATLPEGAVWISEQVADPAQPGRVARWDPGSDEPLTTSYPWANPEGLALDPQGYLWVAETERRELLRISPEGEVQRMAQIEGLPIVIVSLPSGDLLVSVTGEDPHLLRVELP